MRAILVIESIYQKEHSLRPPHYANHVSGGREGSYPIDKTLRISFFPFQLPLGKSHLRYSNRHAFLNQFSIVLVNMAWLLVPYIDFRGPDSCGSK